MGEEKVQVVIIGAGAAGIAAGCRFLENNFEDFIILEASNRIGGRLHTIPMGKGSLDLGAEWVHGEKGNAVYEMASGLDLLYKSASPFETSRVFQSSGRAYEPDIAALIMEYIDEIIDHCNVTEINAYKGSLGDFFTDRYWPKIKPLIDSGKVTRKEAEEFLVWLEQVENSIDGSPSWAETAANEATEYVKLPGEVLIAWKVGGYSTILDILAKRLPNPNKKLKIENKIRVNKEVTRVDWSGERVNISCDDGWNYDAERVIVTVSLNVLKAQAHELFHPALPTTNLNAIKGLGMGTVDKIFLEFPYRWWEPGTTGVSLVWRAEDKARVPKELLWTTGVFGFYAEENHPMNVLCGWVVGHFAEAMEEASDDEVMKQCMILLRRFVGSTLEVPNAVSMHRSKWFSNPYVQGSYSCRMVQSNTMDVWPADLAKPVTNDNKKDVLMFAGEATHDHLFSTVHGAIESGWREADRILSFQQRKKDTSVVIVGAGVAGLAAANLLAASGVDVVVLEAQAVPGGRISSTKTAWGWLELGAQWLHGENSKVHSFAANHDLLADTKSGEGLGRYCRQDGSIVPHDLVSEVYAIMTDILRNCEKLVGSSKYPPSIGTQLEQKLQEYRRKSQFTPASSQIIDELFTWHKRFQLIDNACDDLHDLSARAWGMFRECGENHCIEFKTAFSSVIDAMMAALPENTVRFQTPVRSIDWLESVSNDSTQPRAKVKCDDGEILTDHVIVTCSLGYLKENKSRMFRPELPSSLSKAIDSLGFGTITKVFLTYDAPWWSDSEKGFQFVWTDDEGVTKEVPWAAGLTGFDVMAGRPVLLGWVGGTHASVVETISDEKLAKQATELLKRFTAKPDIPQPKSVIRSSWLSNEFTRGAYSHITSACDSAKITPSTLAQPVYTNIKSAKIQQAPTILFAGEACSKHFYSTVHGAYESGLEQASVIIDYLRKADPAEIRQPTTDK